MYRTALEASLLRLGPPCVSAKVRGWKVAGWLLVLSQNAPLIAIYTPKVPCQGSSQSKEPRLLKYVPRTPDTATAPLWS